MFASCSICRPPTKLVVLSSDIKPSYSSSKEHKLQSLPTWNRRNILNCTGAYLMTNSVLAIAVEQCIAPQEASAQGTRTVEAGTLALPLSEELPPGTKVVYFVRHAEGFHNIGAEYQEDAHLTPFGWKQVEALRNHLDNLETPIDPQVVIVSPLTRTLETAAGVFGGGPVSIDSTALPLMVDQAPIPGVRSAHSAIGPGAVKLVAYEGCRERVGPNRCDRRRNLSETRERFPGVDFSLVEGEDDLWWDGSHDQPCTSGRYIRGESEQLVTQRGLSFLEWIANRPESCIAVVSHCGFIRHTMEGWTKEVGLPAEQQNLMSTDFRNCELRSILMMPQASGGVGKQSLWFPGGKEWM